MDSYQAPGGRVLLGPLLTERQLANRIGIGAPRIRRQPYLARVWGALSVGPAYPAFMIDGNQLRFDLAFLILLLKRRVNDLEACDWLVRKNDVLGQRSPIEWLDSGGSLEAVIELLPVPRDVAAAAHPGRGALDELRRAWLASEGDGVTPGWTIAWEQIAHRRRGTSPVGA